MKKLILFLVLTFLGNASLQAAEPFLFGDNENVQIFVNNRILAKVNGKVISVIDLMKKMDLLFYRQFPEYATSVPARFQFYQSNWKYFLKEMVDKELIVADADESKLQVNNGDVRQEMESLLGPNIIATLDQAGLTFDEAWKMVHSDIVLRRMLYFRVHSKAMKKVTPQKVRAHYEEFAKENRREAEWQYQVISIRSKDFAKTSEVAHLAYDLLTNDNIAPNALNETLLQRTSMLKLPTINVSEEFHHTEKEISAAFKESLLNLEPGHYSQPISQKSKADGSNVFRIFYLKTMSPGGLAPFNEVENQIKDKLIDLAVEKESEAYLKKLHEHFDVQEEMFSEDFQPFSLK